MNKYGTDMHRETTDTRDDTEFGVVAVSEILETLEAKAKTLGYIMVPSGDPWCGYTVYTKDSQVYPGLTPDPGWYRWKALDHRDPLDRSAFIGFVDNTLYNLGNATDSKASRRVIGGILLDFKDRLGDPRAKTRVVINGIKRTVATPRTLTGLPGAFKYCPPVHWFPEEVRRIDARDLLTLFPDAEADQLMLILGRIMAGPSKGITLEGELIHTFRSYGIMVGQEAGMGKSTFLGYLQKAMDNLGYTHTQINTNLNQFGWRPIALSDMAMIDDLTGDFQRRLFHDPRLKMVTSNGEVKVEEKGENADTVESVTVVLGATNLSDYSHYIGMDSGMLSRLNQLDTYNSWELQERWGSDQDYRILPYWNRLGDPILLAMWLFRCSLDRFLDAAGVTLEGSQIAGIDSSKLEGIIKGNRENFRIDVSLKHADELPAACAHLVAMSIAEEKPRDRQELLDRYGRMDFSPDLLLALVTVQVHRREVPREFSGVLLEHLSPDCLSYLRPKLHELGQMKSVKSIEKAFGIIIGELKSSKGFGYPQRSSHYQPQWSQERRSIPGLVDHYQGILEDSKPGEILRETMGNIQSIIRAIP